MGRVRIRGSAPARRNHPAPVHLILLHRLDTQVESVNVGIGKARTAAIYRRPSKEFDDQIKACRIDGKVIGATRVSEDTPKAPGIRRGPA